MSGRCVRWVAEWAPAWRSVSRATRNRMHVASSLGGRRLSLVLAACYRLTSARLLRRLLIASRRDAATAVSMTLSSRTSTSSSSSSSSGGAESGRWDAASRCTASRWAEDSRNIVRLLLLYTTRTQTYCSPLTHLSRSCTVDFYRCFTVNSNSKCLTIILPYLRP